MRPILFLSSLFILYMLPSVTLQAEDLNSLKWEHPMLWRVEGPTPNYLMGTMHLPHPALADFHPLLKEAMRQADAVYLELDMTLGNMAKATMGTMLAQPSPLKQRLPKDIYDRLEKMLASRGAVPDPFDGFKTWAVAMNLQLIDYAAEMQKYHPLDLAIFTKAALGGKDTGGLESVQQQLDVFNNQSDDAQVMFLDMTLKEIEKADEQGIRSADPLLRPYLEGDVIELNKYMEQQMAVMQEMKPEEAEATSKLLTAMIEDRDTRFAENIMRIMKEEPDTVHLFAIGAFHLTGVNNVREHLQNKGIETDRVWTMDDLKSGTGMQIGSRSEEF